MSTTTDRPVTILPWSNEAEQSTLASFMLDPGAFDRAGSLEESDFYSADHRLIYRACAAMAARSRPIDVLTLHEQLTRMGVAEEVGGISYLNALSQSIGSAANVRRYAEIVRERAAHRALMAAADDAVTIAKSADPMAEKLDKISMLFMALNRRAVRQVPKHIAEVVLRRTEHYEALEKGTVKAGWSTSISALDDKLTGGFRPGALYILAARPSVGKSSFAEHLALQFSRAGLPALMLSQEMPEEELADRAVANRSRVAYGALMSGQLSRDAWASVSDAADEIMQTPFYVDDQPALTLGDVRAKARTVQGLKVLVLDYLQLCSGAKDTDSRNAQIETISRGLKALAKEMDIAVIALSQLNRNVEQRANKRPMLADLRDSGAIEQDADVVMFLWPLREEGGVKLVGLGIDKNRQGKCGELCLQFDGDVQHWGHSMAPLYVEQAATKQRKGFS